MSMNILTPSDMEFLYKLVKEKFDTLKEPHQIHCDEYFCGLVYRMGMPERSEQMKDDMRFAPLAQKMA